MRLLCEPLEPSQRGHHSLALLCCLGALCRRNSYAKNAARACRALHHVGRMLRWRPPDDVTAAACGVLANLVDSNYANASALSDEGLLEPVVLLLAKAVAGDAAAAAQQRHLVHQARRHRYLLSA